MTKIQIIVDNSEADLWKSEHGLSLYIEYNGEKILFDTGASRAFWDNLKLANIDADLIDKVILSHGHNDHTGGLEFIGDKKLFYASGIEVTRFSHHKNKPIKELSMPKNAYVAWEKNQKKQAVDLFTEISNGVFLTGKIPRITNEDCGGPFFLDYQKEKVDNIEDEQALLLKDGILIQGCCHSGIINTIEHCKKQKPEIKIKTIIGGLHLVNASINRIEETAKYLNALELEKIILLHCTGEKAIDYFQKNLNCNVIIGKIGKIFN